MRIVAASREEAWGKADKIFPAGYERDDAASRRAGYGIYRHRDCSYYSRICDLGNRLEVMTGEWGENVTNIWIEPAPLSFTAVVTYKTLDGGTMAKTIADVKKVERAWETVDGRMVEYVRLWTGTTTWSSWAAVSVESIALAAERGPGEPGGN